MGVEHHMHLLFLQDDDVTDLHFCALYSVFHNECPNFKTLYFCNHETQMNETCTM